jgi:peptide/bleomycin uptake transporter
MFKFFTSKKWFLWAYLGSFVILSSLWLSVQIDVKINEWFGGFYDMIQKALGTPNAITMNEYLDGLYSFGKLAALWILLGLATSFLTSHFLFRWRTSMVEFYHSVYDKARTIEGASQRVQEDTIRFSRIMEGLGTSFIESVMILIEYFPLLMGLSVGIPIMWFGDWSYGLVSGALIWAVGGTSFNDCTGLAFKACRY